MCIPKLSISIIIHTISVNKQIKLLWIMHNVIFFSIPSGFILHYHYRLISFNFIFPELYPHIHTSRIYVNETIDWDTFCEFSDITSRLFVSDLQLLYDIYHLQVSNTSQCPVYKADRLITLGLLDSATKSMTISSSTGSQTQRYIQTNSLGKLYCQINLS